MSVKILNNVQSFTAPVARPQAATYSVGPASVATMHERQTAIPPDLQVFLEGENPLGCIRGVMWVMAFNVAVFALGFMIWQSCVYLW